MGEVRGAVPDDAVQAADLLVRAGRLAFAGQLLGEGGLGWAGD